MPKPRKNKLIQCIHFTWKLYKRNGVWYADGRSNSRNAGRHSLETGDFDEAKKSVSQLDIRIAEKAGLIPCPSIRSAVCEPLALAAGRQLYETHIERPIVTGGLQLSTRKAYRSYLNKLIPFLKSEQIGAWDYVTAQTLNDFAARLKNTKPPHSANTSYSDKSVLNHLTFTKQLIKWFIAEGHLPDAQPIRLKVRKAESQRPYCWRPIEVKAMIEHCRAHEGLGWLGDVIVALACTGLRISELAGLRWADIDLDGKMLYLSDETNVAGRGTEHRRLKSGRSRSFTIHEDLLKILRRLPRNAVTIFLGPRGGRLKPDTVRRLLIRDVLTPLAETFPAPEGQLGFRNGRLHSFRHYFCSMCANKPVPEQMLMSWLGHADSEMVRHYYHMHDDVARSKMNSIDFLGGAADGPQSTAG